MLKVEHMEAYGFEAAIRGIRNPLNSWGKSDSHYACDADGDPESQKYIIGENDMGLMRRLFKGGTEHRKFMRQIYVSMDITAPLYWWKEFDTYKVGTTANSCSTMHKIQAKEFTLEDFSTEHLTAPSLSRFMLIINIMNSYREEFNETKSKDAWWQMIQLLPTSYNQKRTVTMNYEVAYSIIKQRTGHKLDEWHTFIDELKKLPYLTDIMEEYADE